MQFEDKTGHNLVKLRDGSLSIVKLNPGNLGQAMFSAEFPEDRTSELFVEMAKHFLAIADDDELDAVLEFIRQDPELVAGDPDLLKAILKKNMEAVRAFVEEEVGHLEIRSLAYRRAQVELMRKLLFDDGYFDEYREERRVARGLQQLGPENLWQEFFNSNHWMFGLGLDYRMGPAAFAEGLEQTIKGANAGGIAGHRVDAVLRTRGLIRALCMVEIKHHMTDLIVFNKHYRSGVWQPSLELQGAVSQVQVAVREAVENADLKPDGVFKVLPKSVVVVGSLEQFMDDGKVDDDKFVSFELFRRQLITPEIVTFDELYDRAKALLVKEAGKE